MNAQLPSLNRLAVLVQLLSEARQAKNMDEFAFVVVNQSKRLLPFHLAALWLADGGGKGKIHAVSGIPKPDGDVPFVEWLEKVIGQLSRSVSGVHPHQPEQFPVSLQETWAQWSPPHALWMPLIDPGSGKCLGGIWMNKEHEWTPSEILLAGKLGEGYGETLARFHKLPSPWIVRGKSKRTLILLVAVLLLSVMPIRISVLAPAEIVPVDEKVVAAPMDGVVSSVFVHPNEPVEEEQPLFRLEDTELISRHASALTALSVTEAEYRKVSQAAFGHQESMAEKAILESKIEQNRVEVEYTAALLDRIGVNAPAKGIAVFSDVNDWIGRPVRTGERILSIADPNRVEVLIWLPVADAIVVRPGAEVLMFLNIAPLNPIEGFLRTASYMSVPNADQIVAYRLKATILPNQELPRIGLKGTAKIYGESTSLAWLVFRRPLAALRQLIGY